MSISYKTIEEYSVPGADGKTAYTPHEAAVRLGVSLRTVQQMLKRNQLHACACNSPRTIPVWSIHLLLDVRHDQRRLARFTLTGE